MEKLTEIEFNSMVDVLKRLSKITDNINDSRRRKDIPTLHEDLKSYYYEIIVDMTPGEEKACDTIMTIIDNHVKSVQGVAVIKRNFILKKCQELEILLRKAAKRAGYLTKNIKTTKMKIV